MGRNWLRSGLRWVWRGLLGFAGLVCLYLLAGVIGSAIPIGAERPPVAEGVRVYVIDNGIHTDLVLPAVAEGVDWRAVAKPSDLRDPRIAAHRYVSFGWGNRDFYLNTPRWSDVSAARVAGALFGTGATVLHVGWLAEPVPGPDVRWVTLRPDAYRRLAAFVRGTFAAGPAVPGYGTGDAFYPARGGYSAIRTCNQWTGDALKAGGVRMGVWTPFPFGVMRWL